MYKIYLKILFAFVLGLKVPCYGQNFGRDLKSVYHLNDLPTNTGTLAFRYFFHPNMRVIITPNEYRTSDTGLVLIARGREILDYKIIELHIAKNKKNAYVYKPRTNFALNNTDSLNQVESVVPNSGWAAFEKAFLALNIQDLPDSIEFKYIGVTKTDCSSTGYEFWNGKTKFTNPHFPDKSCLGIYRNTNEVPSEQVQNEILLSDKFDKIRQLFESEF